MSDERSANEPTQEAHAQSGAMSAEATLLDGVRAGHEGAFEAVFQQYYRRIYAMLYRLVGDEADDLAQEVFLKLYYRPPYRAESGLGAWLYRVATNLGYNALRARKRRESRRDALGAEAHGADWQVEAPSPEIWVERQEEQRHIRRALARLKKREATILILRYSDLSYRQIADVLGVASGSVGTLLARAERAFERAYGRIAERDRHSGGER